MCKNPAMRPHRVAVVVLNHFATLDLGVPGQVFWAAETASGEKLYEVVTCSEGRRPVRCGAGYSVQPDHDLDVLDTADTVLVPGIHAGRAMKDGTITDTLLAALQGRPRTMSICTGAFVLAAAGLLDGRPATTHWREAARFAELFPKVRLDPDVLFVDDGDVLTSAGVAAGLDLCLHVIRRDHGSEVANRVARRCVMPPWRDGGQAQYIDRPLPLGERGGTAATRDWMLAHLDAPLDLAALAEHARMSVRTFTRRFREETGQSPAKWLNGQRVQHARHLLETTDLGVEEVARRAGFGTAVSLRQHLHTAVGVSPLAYRRTFRRAL
ncbi:Transcriptional regulator containing an amidase domain and an AraC-type DNA-binding HTH domain [[Actinomadura] parvosata subsp. kistnae]|uniref:AraC family transcriptional regulator n=2 Tax=Nonomuraea TaxID=83681 RepID=A0A1V0AHY0_9ACTN|nr:AraC family transcriptional regulator [Nonomuraea sp. ATCC 55076]SPL90133.1 Transcriptional regulator containing an amidase domain and an AraC-type DNA-binding HTH domain [Actinomadura parvosata subsp. kistnae]